MHRLVLTWLLVASLGMSAPPAAAQGTSAGPTLPSFAMSVTVRTTAPGIFDLLAVDLLTEAYASEVGRRVEALVGGRASVRQVGLDRVWVRLENCSAREIVRVRGALAAVPSAVCEVVDEASAAELGVDLSAARDALAERLEAYDGSAPDAVDTRGVEVRTDDALLRWFALPDEVLAERRDGSLDFTTHPLEVDDYRLLAFDASGAPPFSAKDFEKVALARDHGGDRVLGIWVREDRREDFERFTGERVGRMVGYASGPRLIQAPARLNGELSDHFVVSAGRIGGFSRDEILRLTVSLALDGGLLFVDVFDEGPPGTSLEEMLERFASPDDADEREEDDGR